MDLQSGEPLFGRRADLDRQAEVCSRRSRGQVSVSFKVPGEVLSGNAVVVFETIYDRETGGRFPPEY